MFKHNKNSLFIDSRNSDDIKASTLPEVPMDKCMDSFGASQWKQYQCQTYDEMLKYHIFMKINTTTCILLAMNDYCWCLSSSSQGHQSNNQVIHQTKFMKSDGRSSDDSPSSNHQKIRPRKRRNCMPEIAENLSKILEQMNTDHISKIYSSEKSTDVFGHNLSRRRSKYIGVSKNGHNWQVLINMDNCKKYIGTYESQKEGALAYDFYCIALHGTKAKTNFDYEKTLLEDMISDFISSGNKFNPQTFVSRVE